MPAPIWCSVAGLDEPSSETLPRTSNFAFVVPQNHPRTRWRFNQRSRDTIQTLFVRKDTNVLGIVLEFGYVQSAIRRFEQVVIRL